MPRSAISERDTATGGGSARPFECQWNDCTKCFNRKSDLQRHFRIHTNERPYFCTHEGCQKTFIQRSALTVHIRTHTGEKPHKCRHEGCGKKFSDSSSLARHRRIHSGERNYVCDAPDCGKEFCRKTTLTKHSRKHPHGVDGFRGGSVIDSDDEEWGSEVEEVLPVMSAALPMSRPPSASCYGDHWRLPTRHLQHMHHPGRLERHRKPLKLERSISANSHHERALAKIEEMPTYRFSPATDRALPLMSIQTSMAPQIHTAPVTSTFPHDISIETLSSPDALTNSPNEYSNFPTPTSAGPPSAYLSQAGYHDYPTQGEPLQVGLTGQSIAQIQSPQRGSGEMVSPIDQMISRSTSVSETPNSLNMTTQPSQVSLGYAVEDNYMGQGYREPELVANCGMQYQNSLPMYTHPFGSAIPTWYTNIKPEESWPYILPEDRIPNFPGM